MTALAPHLTAFIRERLPVVRGASPHTCDAYAYTFQLLLNFASSKLHIPPTSLGLEQINASLISEFLDHLRSVRHNSPRTRNARLAAIKSFMHFLEYRVPGALEQIAQVLEIPFHRFDRKLVRHLTPVEQKALLEAPDRATRMGIRDRAMLHLALSAGLRVSELVGLRMGDLHFDGSYLDILVHGKGRVCFIKHTSPNVSVPYMFSSTRNGPNDRGFVRNGRTYISAAAVSDCLEKADQSWGFMPAFRHRNLISKVGSSKCLRLHLEIDLSIHVCSTQRHMSEPCAYGVDVDSSAQKMTRTRVSNAMRADAFRLERRENLCRLCHSSPHQRVYTEARKWLP
jgi:site-specific recombinase XerD